MSIDDCVKLLDAVAKITSALAWPVVLVFFLVSFAPALRGFLENLGEFTFKGAGFEASGKRAEASAALAAAAAAAAATRPADNGEPTANAAAEAREAATIVAETVTPRVLRRAERTTILWVDDRPNNNIYERQSLEALGVKFVLATSTDAALKALSAQHVDVVISDMGRPGDPQAGYTLLEKLRANGNKTPFVIYAGSNSPEYKAEARKRGALGSTNRASELFEYVLSALRRSD